MSDGGHVQLQRLSQSLRAARTAKVLVIGSSSTVGVGASSPSRTYVARLETDLETSLKGTDFEVIAHGMSGEVAQGAADRMKREVEAAKPDLVIWQVGTNDALRHVELDMFKSCLKEDARMASGPASRCGSHQSAVWRRADQGCLLSGGRSGDRRHRSGPRVLLVDRFDAMRKLQRERADQVYLSADNLHMNDEGYRCLAEQLAAAIISALSQGSASVAKVSRVASPRRFRPGARRASKECASAPFPFAGTERKRNRLRRNYNRGLSPCAPIPSG